MTSLSGCKERYIHRCDYIIYLTIQVCVKQFVYFQIYVFSILETLQRNIGFLKSKMFQFAFFYLKFYQSKFVHCFKCFNK